MELDNSNEGVIMKTYIYANSQIIAQHTGDQEADRYFYLHDRLGSVRQLIDTSGNVKNRYTYDPFGELYPDPDFEETVDNPFKFTGQYFDSEIDQYYLRARQYDPHIARFTARDPVLGYFDVPLTLHKYLYCENDPVNLFDPDGASSRSAEAGYAQFTFEHYWALWETKGEPEEIYEVLYSIYAGLDVGVSIVIDSPVLKVVSAGAGAVATGPNMYRIAYYQLLRNGMINVILREDFGAEPYLYDYQDFLLGF